MALESDDVDFVYSVASSDIDRLKKPVIGMFVGPFPKLVPGKHMMNSPYIHAVAGAGGTPLLLPVTGDPSAAEAYIELLDGLLLPGGADITPTLYGEDPVSQVTYLLEDQDRLELSLIRLASERQMPILGICRGIQLLNVAFGGTLYQDLSSQYPGCIGHSQDMSTQSQLTHRAQLVSGSLMEQLLGTESLFVNSYHHQALKETASGFTVSAYAKPWRIRPAVFTPFSGTLRNWWSATSGFAPSSAIWWRKQENDCPRETQKSQAALYLRTAEIKQTSPPPRRGTRFCTFTRTVMPDM